MPLSDVKSLVAVLRLHQNSKYTNYTVEPTYYQSRSSIDSFIFIDSFIYSGISGSFGLQVMS